MKSDIVGIGNALLDFQIEVPAKALTELKLEKSSMQLVEPDFQLKTLAELRTRFEGSDFQISSGGSAANTLAGVANYGLNATFVGKLGKDENGETYANDLKSIGVEFRGGTHKELPTGTCLALITPDAERTMLTSLGGSVELTKADLDIEAISNAPITFFEGYLWDSPIAKESCEEALKIAHQNGRKIAMTFSDAHCVERHLEEFIHVAKSKVDILFCNEAEAMAAAETKDIRKAFETLKEWCDTVCISTGPKGAMMSMGYGKETFETPTWDVKVVDKLGAGDLFASGVLYGILREKSIKECTYLGCYAATRVIQQMSARLSENLADDLDVALQGPLAATA